MTKSPEYLVSFCLAQEGDLATELEAISVLAAFCSQRLRYWEIVYVAGEWHRFAIEAANGTLMSVKNLRVLLVRDAIGYYRRRAIGASEAIGDVVVLTSFNEMPKLDLLEFAEEAMASNRIVMGRKSVRKGFLFLTHSILALISRYHVDACDLKTIALPRDHLVPILARPTAPIDLRFEPKHGISPYVRKDLQLNGVRGQAGLKRRLELLAEIIASSAARFLIVFALVSGLVTAIAASYGVYAIAVILFQENVQAGWFSTAIALSGSSAFISLGLAVVALGIANIVDRTDSALRNEVVEEFGNINLGERVHDINVEIFSEVHELKRNVA